MRTNLKVFRVQRGLSQEEMAERIGYKRGTYSAIECGTRNGRQSFWKKFQEAFGVDDADMWRLMLND